MAVVLQKVAELVVEHASTPEGRTWWAKPLDSVQRIVESDADAQQQLAQQRQLLAAEAEVAAAVQKLHLARAVAHSPGGTKGGDGTPFTKPGSESWPPRHSEPVTPYGARRVDGHLVSTVAIDMPREHAPPLVEPRGPLMSPLASPLMSQKAWKLFVPSTSSVDTLGV